MKSFFILLVVFWLSLNLFFSASVASENLEQSEKSFKAPASPTALEGYYVSFRPNFPLIPGSLNLFGYEREKTAKGYPILSPDKSKMATTEVFFLSDRRKTYSRVFIFPVGELPHLKELIPPERVAEIEAEKQVNSSDPSFTPQVELSEIDPHLFWDRYRPEKHIYHRKTIFEAGFDNTAYFQSDIAQVVDWSSDGTKLLMIFRSGIHHLGVRRTLPVIYDTTTNETTQLTSLPWLVFRSALRHFPELESPPDRVWDIRPLGWNSQTPDDIIVKLLLFNGQSELTTGFWSYEISSGQVRYLGGAIPQELVARNGWIVNFKDPIAADGGKIYEPGETPPEKGEDTKKRSWRDRLLFWKK